MIVMMNNDSNEIMINEWILIMIMVIMKMK